MKTRVISERQARCSWERLIELQLISLNLVGASGTTIGGFGDQATNIVQETAHLAQRTVGRGDNFVRLVGIADGLGDAGDVAAQIFAGDQAGRIVFTRVDSQTGAEPGKRLLESGV